MPYPAFVCAAPVSRASARAFSGQACAARPCTVRAVRRAPARMSVVSPALARSLTAVFGVLMAGGGVAAYTRTKSTMSAWSGVAAGAVLAYAFATQNIPVAFGTAAALAVVFAVRLVKTGKVMPAGVLCGLSVLFAGLFGLALFA